MTLSEEALDRLADIVERQPTKNADLQAAWGLDSGSEVHQYLESELGDYYYRNDDSLICATPEAEALVTGEELEGPRTVDTDEFGAAVLDALPGPDEKPQSVVATLHALREAGRDPPVEEVRSTLHALAERGAAERVRTTVPTFRLALPREDLEVRE
jgi:hypothetical protein